MIQNWGDQAQVATAASDFYGDHSEARLVLGLGFFPFFPFLVGREAKYWQFTLIVIVGLDERIPPQTNQTKTPRGVWVCRKERREGQVCGVIVERSTKGPSFVFTFSPLRRECLCVSRGQVGMRSVGRLFCQ